MSTVRKRGRSGGSEYLTIGPFGLRFPELPSDFTVAARSSVEQLVDSAFESAQNAMGRSPASFFEVGGESLRATTEAMHRHFEEVDSKEGWTEVRAAAGITVYRKRNEGQDVDVKSRMENKLYIVKAKGTIRAPPKRVFDVFMDNDRIYEYNKLCTGVRDLEVVNPETKVVWSASRGIGPFRPRDFVTLIHTRRTHPDSYLVLNRAIETAMARPTRNFVRGEILMAGHLIRPSPDNPEYTDFMTLMQVNPGGFAETALGTKLINRLCANGPLNFIRNLEKVALGQLTPTNPI